MGSYKKTLTIWHTNQFSCLITSSIVYRIGPNDNAYIFFCKSAGWKIYSNYTVWITSAVI